MSSVEPPAALDGYTLLVVAIVIAAGTVVGVLAYLAHHPWPEVIIAGLVSAGASIIPTMKIVPRRGVNSTPR
ncbi:hypothetical protein GCM10027589_12880 [Actinocorallia lasiicapitis]